MKSILTFVWGITVGMWLVTPVPVTTPVNDLLEVGFVLIDPEGYEIARFEE